MPINSHIASIIIDKSKADKAINFLNTTYPNSQIKLVRERQGVPIYIFHYKSNKSMNQLHSELLQIDGVLSVEITERKKYQRSSTNYSFFLLIGLIVSWIVFSILSFLTDFLDTISNAQSLVVEISFAIAVAFWLFRYDQKWQQDVVNVLLDIDILASEIREYVKDLDTKNTKS